MRRFLDALARLRALLIPVLLVAAPHATRAAVPDGFVDEVLASNLSSPASLAFLPDGRLLVTEQFTARVRVITPGAGSATTIFTVPDVVSGAERGLLGVAVDPDWPARPYLYFNFSHAGSVIYVRMYTVSGDLSDAASTNLTLSDPYDILVDIPDSAFNHNGGTLRFGTDGMLLVSTGDDASFCTSQELDDLSGNILRLDVSGLPGAGSGPPAKAAITPADNPFLPTADPNTALIYAYGLRNPFRFTVDSLTGVLYIGDVGAGGWEEVDECQGGENFGWPHREGAHTGPGTFCPGAAGEDPIWEYANPGGAAVVCGPRYRTTGGARDFPAAYEGNLFAHDYYAGNLRRLVDDGGGWDIADPVAGQPNATAWATGLGGTADLIAGPDGALYYANQFNDQVRRITPEDIIAVDPAVGVPAGLGFGVMPNPLRSGRPAVFEVLGDATDASVVIYDVKGARVATLERSGDAVFAWDGRDAAGRDVAAGVYVARLESGGQALASTKLTVID